MMRIEMRTIRNSMLEIVVWGTASALVPVALLCAPQTMFGQMGQGAPGAAAQTNANSQANQQANATSPTDPSQGAMGQMQDKAFLENVAKGDMAEVQLGQLAQQKASSAEVKQLATKMVGDHTKLSEELQSIDSSMGVKEPKKIDKKDQKEYAMLNGLSGDAFDKAYLECLLKNHEKDVKDFKQEESSTANPQLKQLAGKLEQVTEGHLAMAKQVAEAKGVPMSDKEKKSGV